MAREKAANTLTDGAGRCRPKSLAAAIIVAMQSCYVRLRYTIGALPKIYRQITAAGCSKQYYDKHYG